MSEWRVIANTGGAYEVSDDGQVRSVDRMVAVRGVFGASYRRAVGKVLTQFNHTNGYKQVLLQCPVNAG